LEQFGFNWTFFFKIYFYIWDFYGNPYNRISFEIGQKYDANIYVNVSRSASLVEVQLKI
jgi:hypothetical protein